jgi:CO dehydrogenase/acetyl-CoA synthase gamma subunit (corrinoid Fe-S protein)
MFVIQMPSSDLYLDRIDFLKYLDNTDCTQCGVSSCQEFIVALKQGIRKPQDCPFLNKNKIYAFEVALNISNSWPEVPLLIHPRPSMVGIVELNKPDPDSLVLITGNNEYTEQILMTVLGTTISPFYILFVDTDGNTVDMAMIYKTLTAERIHRALKNIGINEKSERKELIIPGFASPIREEIEIWTGWKVITGPICAAELPLFLSKIWIPPND